MEEVQNDIFDAARLIAAMGCSVKALDSYFRRLKSKRTISVSDLNDFSRLASDLPYGNDCDYGALLLEAESDRRCGNDKAILLDAALERARFCASAATSGGEGLARMIHVQRLENKIGRTSRAT